MSQSLNVLGSRDVIGHMTIGHVICGSLLVVNKDYASVLHDYGDMGPQRYWSYDSALL